MKMNFRLIILCTIFFMTATGWGDQGVGTSGYRTLSSLILVQFPNLPAIYHGLETITIKWVSRTIDYVSISCSLDNGKMWMCIADSVNAGSGEYEWLVPDTSSDHCFIRISASSNSYIYDISDCPFSITSVTPMKDNTRSANSHDFLLMNACPNPFNPSTRIRYSIPRTDFVRLKIYDTFGREICIPVNQVQMAGEYTVHFDAGTLSSGVYFYKLQAGSGFVEMKKMLFLK